MDWWMWLLVMGLAVTVGVAIWLWWHTHSGQAIPSQRSEALRTTRPNQFIEQPHGIAPVARMSASSGDDLADIEGIGPRIHDVLIEAGITTFAQLADTDAHRLRDILVAAEVKFAVSPETWPAQARLAADGRWAELKALQDSLRAGVGEVPVS